MTFPFGERTLVRFFAPFNRQAGSYMNVCWRKLANYTKIFSLSESFRTFIALILPPGNGKVKVGGILEHTRGR